MSGKMKRLPVGEPLYGTYTDQLVGSLPAAVNPTLRNWYLSHALDLLVFHGEIRVRNAGWRANPFLECREEQVPETELPEAVWAFLAGGWYVAVSGTQSACAGEYAGQAMLITGIRDRTFGVLTCDACGVRRPGVIPWRDFCGGGQHRTLRGIRASREGVPFDAGAATEHLKHYLFSAERAEIRDHLGKSTDYNNSRKSRCAYVRNLRTLAEQRFAVAQAIGLLEGRDGAGGNCFRRYLCHVAVPTGTQAVLSAGDAGSSVLHATWEAETALLEELLCVQ